MTGPAATENLTTPESDVGNQTPLQTTTRAPSLAGPIDPLLSPPRPPGNARIVLMGMVGAGVMLCAVGLIVNLTRGPANATAAAPPPPNYFTEQQRMAKEAMQMAREVQELQRERLRMMQDEMRNAEEGGHRRPDKDTDPSTID